MGTIKIESNKKPLKLRVYCITDFQLLQMQNPYSAISGNLYQ